MLGVLLLLVAVRQWRGRPRARRRGASCRSGWRTIDTLHARRASSASPSALSGVNPKNLLLTVGAAAAIAQTGADTGEQAVALAVFVARRARSARACRWRSTSRSASAAKRLLDELKQWMGAHNAAIMAVMCLVIGAKLLGDGISGLG